MRRLFRLTGRILLIVYVAAVTLAVIAILAVAGFFAVAIFDRPAYDTEHKDYAKYEAMLHAAMNDPSGPAVDLSELNGGDWQLACVFGGYNDPIAAMRERGAIISEEDERRFQDAEARGFRLSPVEETEMALGYVDGAGQAHFIHFRHGLGPEGQHLRKCVSRPAISMTLP